MTIKATKKPVTIECMKWTGENSVEVQYFCGDKVTFVPDCIQGCSVAVINTLEGSMKATPGDIIIKGVNGEFYPCKPDIFEKTYDICGPNANDSHNFGWALEQLKAGKKVQRKGWNGNGMFIMLQPGSTVTGTMMRNAPAKEFYGDSEVKIQPHVDMKAADNTYTVGWNASQIDMLAEDWQLA